MGWAEIPVSTAAAVPAMLPGQWGGEQALPVATAVGEARAAPAAP